jgi:NADH:ubiquinone oxidoreductase subunit 2 (subunit N)
MGVSGSVSSQLGLELMCVYLLGYLILVLFLGVLLWFVTVQGASLGYPLRLLAGGEAFLFGSLLVGLAGLPPMFFFFCKLGLLTVVLSSGLSGVSALLVLSLGLG